MRAPFSTVWPLRSAIPGLTVSVQNERSRLIPTYSGVELAPIRLDARHAEDCSRYIGSGMVKALALRAPGFGLQGFGFQGGLTHRVRGLGFGLMVKAPGVAVGGVCDGLIKLLLPNPLIVRKSAGIWICS